MERTVLMIRPDQRQKLISLALQENVSVAEINRRAIDFYNNSSSEDLEALNAMINALLISNKEAKKALTEAEKSLSTTLALFSKKSQKK